MSNNILDNIQRVVDAEDNQTMNDVHTDEEIKKVVFELNPERAPGQDGFAGW